jgi:beta-lactamase superfamily II metal-dependent hydrolase
MESPVVTEPIEITVFGGRIGESIVIRLPGDKWGVVDNYTPVLSEPTSNPTLRYLDRHGVERLLFLCLTHPHHDHYRGMSHLLRRFDPDNIWVFDALDHKRLAMLASLVKAKGKMSHIAVEKEISDDFEDLMGLIHQKARDKNRTPRVDIKRMARELPLLKLKANPELTITALAVSGSLALQYEESLSRCFNVDGALKKRIAGVNHNLVSGGLLIEYGSARVILGGDMEKESWTEALKCFGAENRIVSNVFKVSHHGSANGYCEGLWAAASPNRSCIAVVTPYASQGLPSAEGFQHVQQHAKKVLVASASGATTEPTTFSGLSADALLAVQGLFPTSTSSRLEGYWSLSVSPSDTAVQITGGSPS